MKLRFLHLKNYPPLTSARVAFASESPMQRECAIRFVIGANGSGKSHLLQAISEIFLCLADWRPPHFPVTLIYELGTRTRQTVIVSAIREEGRLQPAMWVSEKHRFAPDAKADDFDATVELLYTNHASNQLLPHDYRSVVEPGAWSSTTRGATAQLAYLPRAVLAYSTGAQEPWELLWWRYSAIARLPEATTEESVIEERPPGWTLKKELQNGRSTSVRSSDTRIGFRTDFEDQQIEESKSIAGWRPVLLEPDTLKMAVLATALPMTWKDYQALDAPEYLDEPDESWWVSLRKLFSRAGLERLVGVRITLDFQPEALIDAGDEVALRKMLPWFLACTEAVAQPAPSRLRNLYFDFGAGFDFDARISKELNAAGEFDFLASSLNQIEVLMAVTGGGVDTPPDVAFQTLLMMQREGWLTDIELMVKKVDVDDVIAFGELSDGEQMVLGRMALFHLLRGQQDALLLLDEPETHFNDRWKREIVDIIDDAIGDTANDVLIATHSAIVLSDVFNDEIMMVEKASVGSCVRTVEQQTFATDPSALMMTVFRAEDSIGKRAQDFIDKKLTQATGTPKDVSDLKRLIARMDKGFYRSELRALLNRWELNPDLQKVEALLPDLKSDSIKDDLRGVLTRRQKLDGGDA